MRRRILFVVENITLAQVVRLRVLAAGLDPRRYEVHFASSEFDPLLFDDTHFTHWPLGTIERQAALNALAKGERLYELRTLERYVEEELRLFDAVKPAVVIGDFRLSLAVSAPFAKLPCASLINAYWSPYAVRDSFPVPDHPIVRLVGVERAARYFPQAMPRVFAHFAAPLNTLRRRFGLAEFESLLHALCFGDLVLYPDLPELCPVKDAPPSHHYLGGVQWAPSLPVPDLTSSKELPLVYVTLGSSGDLAALPAVLAGLAGLPLRALLSTAGRQRPESLPPNMTVAPLLPGDVLARHARFVITNGGSSTGYQALAAGTPVLGIPANLDQYLAMTAIAKSGAGILLRSGGLRPEQVRAAAIRLLDSKVAATSASALARAFAGFDCHTRFEAALSSLLGEPSATELAS